MAKSLNRVQLIGNLTRDPELRYTPNGKGVCSFGIATNRSWTAESGEKREEVDFHKIVAWGKLAELCSQFLVKGRKVYVEGRLSTRNWTGQDGTQKTTTEIVIDDMILLDSKGSGGQSGARSNEQAPDSGENETENGNVAAVKKAKKDNTEQGSPEKKRANSSKDEEVAPDDIPF